MGRFLIYFLLLANLCSGAAFAWDTHPEALTGHGSAVLDQTVADDHERLGDEIHHEDHCCHGMAHLMGVTVEQTSPLRQDGERDYFTLSQSFRVLSIPPLLRPPIL